MFKDVQATIHINLEIPLDDLWKNLDKDARWGVKRAEKEGLKIKIIDDDQNFWKEFYKIYIKTMIGGGVAPKNLEELKKETAKLFLCLKNNQIIAGAAIKIHKDETRTELFLNASITEYLKYQPNNLLYWNIIVWSKENNFKIFDLGGYQLNAKKDSKLYHVNKFKKRWGGEVVIKEIKSRNPFYILGRKVIRNVHFIKNLRDKYKLRKYKKNNLPV